MTSFAKTAVQLPREIIDRMREAVALGRWPDGQTLTAEQKQTTLEAVLTWEATHLPPEQRTGHLEREQCNSRVATDNRIAAVNHDDD